MTPEACVKHVESLTGWQGKATDGYGSITWGKNDPMVNYFRIGWSQRRKVVASIKPRPITQTPIYMTLPRSGAGSSAPPSAQYGSSTPWDLPSLMWSAEAAIPVYLGLWKSRWIISKGTLYTNLIKIEASQGHVPFGTFFIGAIRMHALV